MKKNIVFFIENLGGGGAERSVISLAAELSRKGCNVHIGVFDDYLEYEVSDSIGIFNLFPGVSHSMLTKEEKLARVENCLSNLEAQYGPINLIVSNLVRCDEILALVNRNNIYFCIRNHTSIREMQGKAFFKKYSVYKNIRSTYNNKNIIALSYGVAEDLINVVKVEEKSLTVINNGFDIGLIRRMAGEDFHKPFPKYILHVGSFKEQKRHDRLLQAYARSGIDIPLVLLGKGSRSREKKIHSLCHQLGVKEKVYFAGFHANAFPWMFHAEMLVLSSDCEGFPRVLVEALACGTPVVSVDCPSGPSEVLTGELNRCLSSLTVKGLSETMMDVYKNPPIILPEFSEQWSISSIAEKYLAL